MVICLEQGADLHMAQRMPLPLTVSCFTKRHATRVIYRLTVQTLPDGLETQFTPPDTTQTALSCRVWRAV